MLALSLTQSGLFTRERTSFLPLSLFVCPLGPRPVQGGLAQRNLPLQGLEEPTFEASRCSAGHREAISGPWCS